MSKQTYGERLYDYLSSLDYEGLNFEEAEARTWVAEVEALLRVARAAKACNKYAFLDDFSQGAPFYVLEVDDYNSLKEALKEVEGLLK